MKSPDTWPPVTGIAFTHWQPRTDLPETVKGQDAAILRYLRRFASPRMGWPEVIEGWRELCRTYDLEPINAAKWASEGRGLRHLTGVAGT